MTPERTAIVTGAGQRVGAAIAAALVADGWAVLAHVHHQDDQVPPGASRVVADLSEADCAERIFGAAEALPPVRLLINNAARFAWDGFGEFDAGEFSAHMAVNVRAPALLIERFAAGQDPAEDSLIVNLLDSKLLAPNPDHLSYTLSKQALAGLTELAARALAGRGIRVNGIAPGLIATCRPTFTSRLRSAPGIIRRRSPVSGFSTRSSSSGSNSPKRRWISQIVSAAVTRPAMPPPSIQDWTSIWALASSCRLRFSRSAL